MTEGMKREKIKPFTDKDGKKYKIKCKYCGSDICRCPERDIDGNWPDSDKKLEYVCDGCDEKFKQTPSKVHGSGYMRFHKKCFDKYLPPFQRKSKLK